jgi:DNA-binding transcriptional MerR regulator
MPEYSLNELASLADVTPRTIRFYIEQGLLPAPATLGPKSRYTDQHLERLLLIKKLQAAHLPLAEIRNQLRGIPAESVAELTVSTPARVAESAVDYIRGVLGTGPTPAPAARSVPLPSMPAPLPAPAQPTLPSTEPERSQWERISLDPDIELHIRRPMTRTDNKRVARLIEYARQLFEED